MSLVAKLPSKPLLTRSPRFIRNVHAMLGSRDFDLVLINGSDLLWLIPELPYHIPKILIAHNIEHQLFLSQIDATYPRSRLLRGILLRDWRHLRDYEMSGMRLVENIIFLSSLDARFALGQNSRIQALTIPPIFDYPAPEERGPKGVGEGIRIGFMGNFRWWPNQEGLGWFLKEVFPQTTGDTRLHLFGEASGRIARDARVVNHGFVANMADIWRTCDFMICPIHRGGGVNVKFAEAVYNRMPVLATSFAARGLPLEPDPSVVLLDRADEWVSFLLSPAARELRARRLPARMANAFAMESHVQSVQGFVQSAIARKKRSIGDR